MNKSIKEQYIELNEGKMTQAQFMRNIRMVLPEYITSVNNFRDSVKILKNKGIIVEADEHIKESTGSTLTDIIEKLFDGDYNNDGSALNKARVVIEASNHPDKATAIELIDKKLARTAVSEALGTGLSEELIDQINNGEVQIYDILSGNIEVSSEDLKHISDMYDSIAFKYRLHPDDDFQEIEERMYDLIGDTQMSNGGDLEESYYDDSLEKVKKEAEEISRKEGVVQHVNDKGNGKYEISDWYDSDSTIVSYEGGRRLNEERGDKGKPHSNKNKDYGVEYTPRTDYRIGENFHHNIYGTGKIIDVKPISAITQAKEGADVYVQFNKKDEMGNNVFKNIKIHVKTINSLSESKLTVNDVNAQELLIGINWEGKVIKDKEAATKKALSNLSKDPFYYTILKFSNTDDKSKKTDKVTKRIDVDIKAEKDNIVDKANGMKAVKGFEKAKASANKTHKETSEPAVKISLMSLIAMKPRGVDKMDPTGEKMKKINVKENSSFEDRNTPFFQTLKADEKYNIEKDAKGHIVQATNDEGVIFSKNDLATAVDNGEKIKIIGFYESQGKVKAIYLTHNSPHTIDIDGLEKIEIPNNVDLGQSFEKFKDINEYEGEGEDSSIDDENLGYYAQSNTQQDKAELLTIAKDYANGYSQYIDESSIKFEGDEESWSLEFNLIIPVDQADNITEEELENELAYSSHGVEGNPGGSYSRASISVENNQETGDWVVTVYVRGGLDI